MVVKLGKIVYVFTQHVHTTFEISSSFISQNITFEMLFLFKNRLKIHIILVCKLYIHRAINLKLGMLVYIITPNMYMYTFKSQSYCIVKISSILWFCTIKRAKTFECLLVCKIHILKLNGLKFSENVYFNKAHLKI